MTAVYAGIAALLSRVLPDPWLAPGEFSLFAILIAGVAYAIGQGGR